MSNSNLKSIIHATYASALSKRKLLSADQQKELFEKKDSGDMKARNKIIESNLRLAVSVALKSKEAKNQSMEIEDIISMANIGLIKAVDKFDHNLGYKFSTYAVWWIREAIQRTSNDENNQVYIPFEVSQKIKIVKAISNRLSNELSREATHEEIAVDAKLTAAKVADLLSYSSYIMTSGEDKDDDNSMSEFDTIEIEGKSATDIIYDEQINARVHAAINTLDSREKTIIKCLNGIDTEEHTLGEIGKILNLSRERVRQISVKVNAALAVQLSDIESVVPVVKIARKKKKLAALEALDLMMADAEEVISVDLSTTAAAAEESSTKVVAIASEPLKNSKVSFELLPFWNDQLKNSAKLMLSTSAALLDAEVNMCDPLLNINSGLKAHSRPNISRYEYKLVVDQRSVLSASISASLAVPGELLALSNTSVRASDFIRSTPCLRAKKSSWTDDKRRLTSPSPGRINDSQFQAKAKVIAMEDAHKAYLDALIVNKGSGGLLAMSHAFRNQKDTLVVSDQSIFTKALGKSLAVPIKFPENPPAKSTNSRLTRKADVFNRTAFSPGNTFERYPYRAYSSA